MSKRLHTNRQKGEIVVYDPKEYWEARLSSMFNLSRVGTLGFGKYYNRFLYRAKVRTLEGALFSQRIDLHNKTVCDIGCGTGFFVDFYHCRGAKDIVGVDITDISIKKLKQKYPNSHFIEEDISSPALVSKINRGFDILNAFDVLYHITDDKTFSLAIENICKLTNYNGFIFISDSFGSKNISIAQHVKLRSRELYKATLEENGVEIIAIYPLYYLLNRPILGMTKITGLNEVGMILDALFAPIYYCLDAILLSAERNNLSLICAKKVRL